MTISYQPPLPSPLHAFPFFRAEHALEVVEETGARLSARPWALVALPDDQSSVEVAQGLEWGGFEVRRAQSGAAIHRIVSNLVVGDARRMPALVVLAATLTDGSTLEVIRTFAGLGWGIPILVCLAQPSEACTFEDHGAYTLCAPASGLIVGAAIRLWASGSGSSSPLHFH